MNEKSKNICVELVLNSKMIMFLWRMSLNQIAHGFLRQNLAPKNFWSRFKRILKVSQKLLVFIL